MGASSAPRQLPFPHILAYNASAGTGKTHQLALHYLRLLLRDRTAEEGGVGGLLCITFTNAAVKEMAERILNWLKALALGGGPEAGWLTEPLRTAEGEAFVIPLPPVEELKERARKVFEEDILRSYEDLRISTIDSFMAQVLRAEALRLGLPPSFEFRTEIRSRLEEVLDALLQRVLTDAGVRAVFEEFVETYLQVKGKDAAWTPRALLDAALNDMWSFFVSNGLPHEALEGRAAGDGQAREDALAHQVRHVAKNILFWGRGAGTKVHKRFLDRLLCLVDQRRFSLKDWSWVVAHRTIPLNKGSVPLPAELLAEWESLVEGAADLIRTKSREYYHGLAEVYRLFVEELRSRATREGEVLMSEVPALLRGSFREGDADLLGLYLCGRIGHYLVDEFQDTSAAQWKVLEPFVSEALSRGGSLFTVGDRKQSIYGWRGAKPELMEEFAEHLSGQAPFYAVPLDRNHRSDGVIVEFNNALFDPAVLAGAVRGVLEGKSSDDGGTADRVAARLSEVYAGHSQRAVKPADRGLVTVTRVELDKETGNRKEGRMEAIRRAFESLLDDLTGRWRPGDLCVLCRDNRQAATVVSWLMDRRLPVESAVTVDIRHDPLVRELLSFLEWSLRPTEDGLFRAWLTGRVFAAACPEEAPEVALWCDRTLLASGGGGRTLYAEFRERYPDLWKDRFEPAFVRAGYEPAWEFAAKLLRDWRVFENFPRHGVYFLKFLSAVAEAERTVGSHLLEVVATFRDPDAPEETFRVESGEGQDAVKVMTVHKAKGLKFPVVILPFLSEDAPERPSEVFEVEEGERVALWHVTGDHAGVPDLAERRDRRFADIYVEEVNIAYVACTRAGHELHILLYPPEVKKNWFTQAALSALGRLGCQDAFLSPARAVVRFGSAGVGEPAGPAEAVSEEALSSPPDLSWEEFLRSRIPSPADLPKYAAEAARRGECVHEVLRLWLDAGCPGWGPTETDAALRRAAAVCGLAADESSAEEVRSLLALARGDAEFLRVVTPAEGERPLTEAWFCDGRGELHRPDLVLVGETTVRLVDYKTVEALPERPPEEHLAQMRRYGRVVPKVLGRNLSGMWLVYLSASGIRVSEVVS